MRYPRPHSICSTPPTSSVECSVSLRGVLHTLLIFIIDQTQYLQRHNLHFNNPSSFKLQPRIYLSDSDAPRVRPQRSPSHLVHANSPPSPLSSSFPSLLGVGSSSAGSIHFAAIGAHPRVYRSRFWVGLAIPKMAVGDSGGCTSGGAEGETVLCVGGMR